MRPQPGRARGGVEPSLTSIMPAHGSSKYPIFTPDAAKLAFMLCSNIQGEQDLGPLSQNESKRPRWSPTTRWNLRIRAYERDQVWNRVACGITRSVSHGLSEISGWQSYVTWNMAETHAIRVRDFLFQS